MQDTQRPCWCGSNELSAFAPAYGLCKTCGTLVSQAGLANDNYLVQNDETDFYGKKYWLDHMADDLGLPRIQDRARLDLPERCVYWLRHLLSYRLPPAKVLELGAAHGAFTALMRWAGFDATGLELSPWVAELARSTFLVPMLLGPIERQNLVAGSCDVIVANDVMEHLPDPLATLGAVVKLLKPDGVLIIQMPEFVEGKNHAERVAAGERFLEHTKIPTEHLYLYSRRSAGLLLGRLGLDHLEFSQAIFDYDMYFMASRQPLRRHDQEAIAASLQTTPTGRMAMALLDKDAQTRRLTQLWQEAEADRHARLEIISKLSRNLDIVSKDLEAQLHNTQQQGKIIRTHQAHTQNMQDAVEFLQATCLDSNFGGWPGVPRLLVKLLLPEWIKRRVRKRVGAGKTPASQTTSISGMRK